MLDTERLPDLEKSVLGTMLAENRIIPILLDYLDEECFTEPLHIDLFKTIKTYYLEDTPIDVLVAYNALKNKYKKSVVQISEMVSTSTTTELNAKTHAILLLEKKLARKLLKSTEIIKKEIESGNPIDEVIYKAEELIFEIATKFDVKKEITLSQSVNEVVKDLEEVLKGNSEIFIKTGLIDFDNLAGGLKPGELIVLGARPSMGKTSLAVSMIKNISITHPVLFFTLEMSHKSITTKLLSFKTGITAFRLLTGKYPKEDKIRIGKSAIELMNLKLLIDDNPVLNIYELKSKAKKIKLRDDIKLIVIDYLQLIRAKADTREREIALISSELKSLAKQLDIPILCLSQLNRSLETRADKRPTLADLRESGAIEQDADLVLFLYRDEYYGVDVDDNGNSTKGIAELIVAKNRNGAVGKVKLHFNSETTDFNNLAENNQLETYYNDII
jgi:replicative DNA helicase